MPEALFQLIALCFLLLFTVTAGLSVFAFSDAHHFVEWVWPLHWLTRKIWGDAASKKDGYWAKGLGIFFLLWVAVFAGLLGAWITTILLGLWSSPLYRLIY